MVSMVIGLFCEDVYVTLIEFVSDLLADPATDVDEVAADWVARYGKDNIEALRELVNFMIRVRI